MAKKREKINHAFLSKYSIVLDIIKKFILKISMDYEINTKYGKYEIKTKYA